MHLETEMPSSVQVRVAKILLIIEAAAAVRAVTAKFLAEDVTVQNYCQRYLPPTAQPPTAQPSLSLQLHALHPTGTSTKCTSVIGWGT